jgi:hypothetical protein
MRPLLCVLVISLAGLSFAQDTNFSAGPQYLVTSGSPMLMQPIATPSLSLNAPMPDAYIDATQLAPAVMSGPSSAVPSNTFWPDVLWGQDKPIAARVVTPSATPEETAVYTYATANLSVAGSVQAAETTEVPTKSSVIEITSPQMPPNLPASIFDAGVTGTADPQWLLSRGYGVSLGDFARYWKSRKRPSAHVFTNEDLHSK